MLGSMGLAASNLSYANSNESGFLKSTDKYLSESTISSDSINSLTQADYEQVRGNRIRRGFEYYREPFLEEKNDLNEIGKSNDIDSDNI